MSSLWSQLDAAEMPVATWLVVIGITAVAAVTDWRSRRIPNALTFPSLLAALIYAAAAGGWGQLGGALGGMLLCAMPFVLLFLFAGGGAGDAKLMAGVGAWLGLFHGGFALAAVALVGGLAAVVWSLAAGDIRRMVSRLSFASTGLIGLAHGRVQQFRPLAGDRAGRRCSGCLPEDRR